MGNRCKWELKQYDLPFGVVEASDGVAALKENYLESSNNGEMKTTTTSYWKILQENSIMFSTIVVIQVLDGTVNVYKPFEEDDTVHMKTGIGYIKALTFQGAKPGYVFKTGAEGIGYYREIKVDGDDNDQQIEDANSNTTGEEGTNDNISQEEVINEQIETTSTTDIDDQNEAKSDTLENVEETDIIVGN